MICFIKVAATGVYLLKGKIMKNDTVIKIENLTKVYRLYDSPMDRLKESINPLKKKYHKDFYALNNISFEISKGETVGIIGKNGSGKSTLLKIITGVLSSTSGKVMVNGKVSALLELGAGFNPEYTGIENIYMNGMMMGYSREEMNSKLDSILEFADIGDFVYQPVKMYSSGMFARLAFSVQAKVDPQILIVDEALSVGDEKFQRKCFNYMEKLRQNGTTILVVTHSIEYIEKFTKKALLLNQGNQHGFGLSKNIIDQYHALLYADEVAYLSFLNKKELKEIKHPDDQEHNDQRVIADTEKEYEVSKQRAFLEDICIEGNDTEVFYSGDSVVIRVEVKCYDRIKKMQAGIKIRTVEGITVYGTHTGYFEKSPVDLKNGDTVILRFRIKLDLCEGIYFISIAIAEKEDFEEMVYLDKRSDFIVLKIREPKITVTGISHLDTEITCEMEN